MVLRILLGFLKPFALCCCCCIKIQFSQQIFYSKQANVIEFTQHIYGEL